MTAKFPRSTWLLLVSLLALIAAGCGGGESGLSEGDFTDEFDSACQDVSDELDNLDTPQNNEELADLADQAVEIASDGIAELSDITPPDDLQDEVDDLLGLLQDRVDLFEELANAAADDDNDAINDLSGQNDDLEADVDAAGEDLGLECFADSGDQSDDLSGDLSDNSSDFSDDFSNDFSNDFSDDFSNDFSDDFSNDFSDDLGSLGEAVAPSDFIPEYGTADRDARFDGLADSCFAGDLADCDRLYSLTPVSELTNSYEGYGATCGGRLPEEQPGTCATRG